MTAWYCPTCGGPNKLSTSQKTLRCGYCQMQAGVAAIACTACGQLWPSEYDNCRECGEPLSTVGRIFQRHAVAGAPPPWLERNRQQAEQVKMNALAASEARMEKYLAMEQQRIACIRQSEAEQRSADRRLFLYVLALVGAILFLILVVGMFAVSWP